jgi:ADP-heptose:LPS heptosyltransferase
MCYKANVKYRIGGFSRIKRFPTFLYTRRTFPTLITHSLDYSFGIVNKLGVRKPSNLKTEVYVSKLAEKKVSTMVKSPYVVIHPGFGPINSKSPPRSWQNDKYAVIADQLSKKFNVIFSGLADQKDLINDILDKCQNKKKIFNLAGKTNMEQFCALIKNSKLVLAPDTGASHLAASFGVPLVNLMDAPIEEWAPIGKKDKVINIYHPREIAILENAKLFSKVGGVKSISVEEVKKAIDKLV